MVVESLQPPKLIIKLLHLYQDLHQVPHLPQEHNPHCK
jgi:hypothetical protein